MEAMSEQERFEHGNIPRDFELRRRITNDLTEVVVTLEQMVNAKINGLFLDMVIIPLKGCIKRSKELLCQEKVGKRNAKA